MKNVYHNGIFFLISIIIVSAIFLTIFLVNKPQYIQLGEPKVFNITCKK